MFVNSTRMMLMRTAQRSAVQSHHLAARSTLFRSFGFSMNTFTSQQRSYGIAINPFSQFNSVHEILTRLYEPNMHQFDTHGHALVAELTHHIDSGRVEPIELYKYIESVLGNNTESSTFLAHNVAIETPTWLEETVIQAKDIATIHQETRIIDDNTTVGKKEENLPAERETSTIVPAKEEPKKERNYDNFFKNATSMFGKATNYFGKAVAALGLVIAICEILTELDELQEQVGKKQANQAALAQAEQTLSAKATEIQTLNAQIAQLEIELNTWGQWLLSFITETQTAQAHKQHQAEKIAAQQHISTVQAEAQSLNSQIATADKRIKEVVTGRVKKGTDYVVGKGVDKLTDKLPKPVIDPIDDLLGDISQKGLTDAIKGKTSQIIADSLLQPALKATEDILSSENVRDMVALSPEVRQTLLTISSTLTPIKDITSKINDWLPIINKFLNGLGTQQ